MTCIPTVRVCVPYSEQENVYCDAGMRLQAERSVLEELWQVCQLWQVNRGDDMQ